jgi:hypothetical protein
MVFLVNEKRAVKPAIQLCLAGRGNFLKKKKIFSPKVFGRQVTGFAWAKISPRKPPSRAPNPAVAANDNVMLFESVDCRQITESSSSSR